MGLQIFRVTLIWFFCVRSDDVKARMFFRNMTLTIDEVAKMTDIVHVANLEFSTISAPQKSDQVQICAVATPRWLTWCFLQPPLETSASTVTVVNGSYCIYIYIYNNHNITHIRYIHKTMTLAI